MTIKVQLGPGQSITPVDGTSSQMQSNVGQFATLLPHIIAQGLNTFDLSIQGLTSNGSGTVTLDRSFNNGETWGTVKSYTADAEEFGTASHKALYRVTFTGTVAAGKLIAIIVR